MGRHRKLIFEPYRAIIRERISTKTVMASIPMHIASSRTEVVIALKP